MNLSFDNNDGSGETLRGGPELRLFLIRLQARAAPVHPNLAKIAFA